MKRTHKLIAAGCLIGTVALATAAYASADDQDANRPASVNGFGSAAVPITDRERELLGEHTERVSDTGSGGPNAGSTMGLSDTARLMIAEHGIRVAAIRSSDGGACYVVTDSVAGTDYRTGCATAFNEYGFTGSLGEFSHHNPTMVFAGIVANDVTDIVATMPDSSRQPVTLENNAFAQAFETRPASMSFTRNGEVRTLVLDDSESVPASLAIADRPGPTADPTTYRRLQRFAGTKHRIAIGARPQASQLVSIGRTRRVAGTGKTILTLVPTTDNSGFCYQLDRMSNGSDRLFGSCIDAFPASGVEFTHSGSSDDRVAYIRGIASDRVVGVSIKLDNGETRRARLANSTFEIAVPPKRAPMSLVSTFTDGTSHATRMATSLNPEPSPRAS